MAEEAPVVKAKLLIEKIEKGEVVSDPGPLSPEMVETELAPKGTTKSLKSMFEQKPAEPPVIVRKKKTPSTTTPESNGVSEDVANGGVAVEELKPEEAEPVAVEAKVEESQAAPQESKPAEEPKSEVKPQEEVKQEEKPQEEAAKKEEPKAEEPKTSPEPAAAAEKPPSSGSTRRNVLIVYANDDPQSLVHALVDAAKTHFTETGCDVALTDLLGDNFNPVVSAKDIGGCESVAEAFEKGELASDIVKEQSKVTAADLVLLAFPQYLHGYPAVIKGWLDRILSVKFAYDIGDKLQMFDEGKLKGKRALVCQTIAGPASAYTDNGIIGDFNVYMFPLEWGMLRFAGFDVLNSQSFFGTFDDSEAKRTSRMNEWNGRLESIWTESPRQFLSVSLFDKSAGFTLTEAAKLDLQTRSSAVSVAHHLGKPVTSFKSD